MYDEDGNLSRVAIITTNSCTNIKTYANLKYMNQVYIRDQFLMIRDGDGKIQRIEKTALQVLRGAGFTGRRPSPESNGEECPYIKILFF